MTQPFTTRKRVPLETESLSAWARGGIGRRDFLRRTAMTGAGLVIAIYLPSRGESAAAANGNFAPNAWLQIDPKGEISLWVARSEMGQGVRTSMLMILAEELEADWKHVKIVQADSEAKFGDMVTGGSASVRTSWDPLRKAGATGRAMLISAAAQEWKVPVAECTARDEKVHHAATKRSLAYGALAEKAAKLPVPKEPALKDAKEFEIVGKNEPRVDGPKIVVGAAKYGVDTKLPGMKYAVIARSPVFSGKVKKFDATKAMAVPGVKKVVEVPAVEMVSPFGFGPAKPGHQHYLPSGVAVIADSTWQAIQGRKALEIEWDDAGHGSENTADHRAKCAEMVQSAGQEVMRVGDAEAAFAKAPTKIEAVYEVPFLAHTPMEPPNCTADFKNGRLHDLGADAECARCAGGSGACVGSADFGGDRCT